jgi:bacterioferritin-associated ferredoxin
MIVCICNAIRETEIRQCARAGLCDVDQIYQTLGCQTKCRQCVPFAREIVESEACAAA